MPQVNMRFPPARQALVVGALMLALVTPARADTHLHLGETATIMVPPDEITGSLRVEVTAPTAAEAQRRVNDTMRDALAQAKATQGVTATTGGYGVWRTGPTPQDKTERWQATQTLNLIGHDGPVLLQLVGVLQQKGLAIGELGWRLARATERKAHQEATQQALTALRGRAEEAAGNLGLKFSQFADVRLDSAPRPPQPRLFAPMAMAAAAPASPPSAAAEDVAVTASVEADVILVPQ